MEKKSETIATLFSEFPYPSVADWKKVASAEVGGADPFEKLAWASRDGLTFLPIYTSDDASARPQAFQLTDGLSARYWANLPLVNVADERQANGQALAHLEQEAEGVLYQLNNNHHDFAALLSGIAWENCTISFLAEDSSVISDLTAFLKSAAVGVKKVNGAFFVSGTPQVANGDTSIRISGIRILPSTPVQEVSEALVKGVRIFERYIDNGIAPQIAAYHIAFMVPVSADLLSGIAALRALRRLWYQVVAHFGVDSFKPDDLYLHGFSAVWTDPKFQPHGNMLKGTVAALAALCGGCNALTVEAEEADHAMMTRIARNTSHILREESHLDKVNDPFAGSYALEKMTDEIARAAWTQFQKSL